MAHARTAIRNALSAALVAANTPAAARVYTESRDGNVGPADCPHIRLIVESEPQEATSMGGGRANRPIERKPSVKITYVCMQPQDYINDTDDALALIEVALANLVGNGIKDITPGGVTFDIDNNGDTPVYSAEQSFEVFYITPQGNPAATL